MFALLNTGSTEGQTITHLFINYSKYTLHVTNPEQNDDKLVATRQNPNLQSLLPLMANSFLSARLVSENGKVTGKQVEICFVLP